MIVTNADQLEQLVDEYCRYDAVVFDLETMYIPTLEEAALYAEYHETPKKYWEPDVKAWVENFELKATDPLVNTTIWFGLATYGRSDAVATGHPNGALIDEGGRREVIACEWFPEDDPRHWTPGGKPRQAKVEVTVAPTFTAPPPQLDVVEACEIMHPLFFDTARRVINQNVKFDIKSLVRHFGDFIPGPYGETQIAQHLVDENAFMNLQLGNLVEKHLDHAYDKLGSKGVHNFSFDAAARYAEQDAKFVWLLWRKYQRILEQQGLMDLFEFEMQIMDLLMRKEYAGALVDREAMAKTRASYEERKEDVKELLLTDYPVPPTFNFDSTQQKAKLLYEDLGAPVHKTTDSGAPSTDADTLEKLTADKDTEYGEVAQLLLDYAEVSKVIGTYFVGMGAKLDEYGYLHPDFTQHVADTNRLSCRAPNLHNIPRDSDMRDMFIAPPGMVVIGADYDQIELRFICVYAQDPTMMEVFNSGEDVHATTAALVLDKDLNDVSSEERTLYGKMPNFLIGYGGTAYTLAQKTGIPEKEAEHVLHTYFSRFSRINPWKEEVYKEALGRMVYRDGKMIVPPYVETMMGYRRRLPDLTRKPHNAPNNKVAKELRRLKARAERQAVNSITQGSAAETLKIAMLDIDTYCRENNFPMRLAINIHDEILCYCDERHAEEGKEIVEILMTSVVNPFTGEPPLRGDIELKAAAYISDRWLKG